LSTEARPIGRWPEGYDRLIFDEIDSTMAEAARRGQAFVVSGGPLMPTWIMARSQTAGRGRRGRVWRMPKGNLAATLLIPTTMPPAQAALTSFVAALALHDALAKSAGRAALSLKWPNDVLVDGRKAAGILLESSGRGGQLDWLSVGIGVNLAAAPDASALEDGAVAPISVAEIAADVPSPEEVLTDLAIAFDGIFAQFVRYGFDPIRRAWLGHAARLGERIIARTGREEIAGRFDTIDGEGNLVLTTDQGPRAIAAADVFF